MTATYVGSIIAALARIDILQTNKFIPLPMNAHKRDNILQLSAQERYGYFIRTVADAETVWVIRDGTQTVMLGEGDAQLLIPVWPEEAFAQQHLTGEWSEYLAEEMPLDNFMAWLDQMQAQGVGIAAFPKQDLTAVVVEAHEMKAHLLHELQQYE